MRTPPGIFIYKWVKWKISWQDLFKTVQMSKILSNRRDIQKAQRVLSQSTWESQHLCFWITLYSYIITVIGRGELFDKLFFSSSLSFLHTLITSTQTYSNLYYYFCFILSRIIVPNFTPNTNTSAQCYSSSLACSNSHSVSRKGFLLQESHCICNKQIAFDILVNYIS